jgi:two-component system, response regulator PdtaR
VVLTPALIVWKKTDPMILNLCEDNADVQAGFEDCNGFVRCFDDFKRLFDHFDSGPPIKIVATSGHVKIGAGDLPQGGRFLRKPYSPAEIMQTLRELIAA